jgi:hypothetical protein
MNADLPLELEGNLALRWWAAEGPDSGAPPR